MARRAGCGVAAKGGVMDGCYAAYTTSVTFGDSFISAPRAAFGGCAPKRACGRSPQGEAFAPAALNIVNNNLPLVCSLCQQRCAGAGVAQGDGDGIGSIVWLGHFIQMQ